jgi:hypothetical protein
MQKSRPNARKHLPSMPLPKVSRLQAELGWSWGSQTPWDEVFPFGQAASRKQPFSASNHPPSCLHNNSPNPRIFPPPAIDLLVPALKKEISLSRHAHTFRERSIRIFSAEKVILLSCLLFPRRKFFLLVSASAWWGLTATPGNCSRMASYGTNGACDLSHERSSLRREWGKLHGGSTPATGMNGQGEPKKGSHLGLLSGKFFPHRGPLSHGAVPDGEKVRFSVNRLFSRFCLWGG